MTSFTARSLSSNRLQQLIHQIDHDFDVGTVVGFDGVNYVRSLADTPADARTIGMVSFVVSDDDFVLTQQGHVVAITYGNQGNPSGAQPFTPGARYYLTDNITYIGQVVANPPTTAGHVILPLFDADTVNSGYFMNNPGEIIGTDDSMPTVITTMDVNPLVPDTRYIYTGGIIGNFTLPATFPAKTRWIITNDGDNGLVVICQGSAIIRMGTVTSTVGNGAESTQKGDSMTLIAVTANTELILEASAGSAWNLA